MALGSFTADLSKFVEKTKLKPGQVMQKVAFDLFSAVQRRTPRDTLRAVTGWQVGVGAQPSGSDPGPGQHSPPPPPVIPTIGPDQAVYYINNVHYVPYLEYGTASYGFSRQAPAGMVRISIAEFQSYVAKALASLP
jgi:hypothetical protein